jgi:hypothetical protein
VTKPRLALWLALAGVGASACGRRPAPTKPDEVRPSPKKAAPAVAPPEADDEGSLVEETPERDPRSETVTIKLSADPARKAHVYWGRKDLGLAPLELTRPRNSGPLDLLIVTPGALTMHTRVFTDRDDKLSLRLYADADAPAVLGYRASDVPAPTTEAPDKPAKRVGAGRVARPRPAPTPGVP